MHTDLVRGQPYMTMHYNRVDAAHRDGACDQQCQWWLGQRRQHGHPVRGRHEQRPDLGLYASATITLSLNNGALQASAPFTGSAGGPAGCQQRGDTGRPRGAHSDRGHGVGDGHGRRRNHHI